MSLPAFLNSVWARLDAATPGPWVHAPGGIVQSKTAGRIIFWDDRPNVGDTHELIRLDYSFIANAPTDLAKALEVIEVLSEALELIERAYATHGERMAHQDYAAKALAKADEVCK